MKSKKARFLTILLIVGIFHSCENDQPKPKDYRQDYLGNFQFSTYIKEYITDTTYTDTTINYLGLIDYGISDSQISIHSRPNYTIYPFLQPDGTLSSGSNSGLGSVFGGQFETKDKVTFGSATGSGANLVIGDVTGIRK